MVTLSKASYQNQTRVSEFIGLSTDNKPTDVSGSEAADAITTLNTLLASLRAAGLIADS